MHVFFFLCSDLRVPRKCLGRRTGSVWQLKCNMSYLGWRVHMPSETMGCTLETFSLSPADAAGCDCHALSAIHKFQFRETGGKEIQTCRNFGAMQL